MATSSFFAIGLAGDVADQLNIVTTPQIWALPFLIPLTIIVCKTPSVGIGPVMFIRLLVILCMNFVQKLAVKSWPVMLLLAYQMVLQSALLAVTNYKNMKVGKWSDLGWWLLYITPFWTAQLMTSLYAFKEAPVSTIQIMTTLQPVIALLMEKVLKGVPKKISVWLMTSILMVLMGTALYVEGQEKDGGKSASVTPNALMWILTNVFLTVVATVFRGWFLKDPNFSVSLPMAMCSVAIALTPSCMVAAFLSGEMHKWNDALTGMTRTAWFYATTSGLVAGCFSFLQFRCQTIISGTSDLMFQNAVKIFIIIMGVVLFSDTFDSIQSFAGCCIALGGCAWYGRLRLFSEVKEGTQAAKTAQSNAKAREQALVAPEDYRQLA